MAFPSPVTERQRDHNAALLSKQSRSFLMELSRMRWLHISISREMARLFVNIPVTMPIRLSLSRKGCRSSASVDPADEQSALNNPKVECPLQHGSITGLSPEAALLCVDQPCRLRSKVDSVSLDRRCLHSVASEDRQTADRLRRRGFNDGSGSAREGATPETFHPRAQKGNRSSALGLRKVMTCVSR